MYRERRGLAPIILNPGTRRRRWVVNFTHKLVCFPERTLALTEKKFGLVLETVGTFCKIQIPLASAAIRRWFRPSYGLVAMKSRLFRLIHINRDMSKAVSIWKWHFTSSEVIIFCTWRCAAVFSAEQTAWLTSPHPIWQRSLLIHTPSWSSQLTVSQGFVYLNSIRKHCLLRSRYAHPDVTFYITQP